MREHNLASHYGRVRDPRQVWMAIGMVRDQVPHCPHLRDNFTHRSHVFTDHEKSGWNV
jgi:hypothetical protein